MRPSEIANAIKPFVLGWIKDVSSNSSSSGGAGTGVAVHDFLGPYHTRPSLTAGQFLASPAAATGLPDFRAIALSDIQSVADTRYALAGRLINAGGGLTGGGALTADVTLNVGAGTGITVGADAVNVNEAHPFSWSASHTFGAGMVVSGTNAITFGGGLGDTLSMARTSAITMTLVGTSGASVFEASILRGVGTSAGLTLDDRVLNDGTTSRWFVHVNSNIWQWKFGPGAATTVLNLDRYGSLRSPSYVSQTTGANVDFGTGSADFRYLFTDELHAKSFIADLEQALAGAQIISKSVALLHLAFTAPAAGASTTMTVRDLPSAPGMQVFPNGDYIRARDFTRSAGSLNIGDCWGTVALDTTYGVSGYDSATKTQRYTFTRSSGADAGGMAAGTVIQPDAVILDYGTAGNGIAEVNAIDGVYGQNSPYYRVATWATHPRTMTERVRMGNLRGITSIAGEFGLYAGDGGITSSNKFIRLSNSAFALNNVDLEIYRAGVRRFRIDSSVPYIGLGSPNPTSYLGATGFFVGDNGSGTYQLHIGSTSASTLTAGMSWDGSTLNVIGAINAVSGTFSGVVSVGVSGGIYQGTGSFATPTTGLKIWNDSGVGRIAGYGSGTLQWSSDTTGKIIAGGGNVYLDSTGLNFTLPSAGTGAQNTAQSIDFVSGGTVRASIFGSYQTLNGLRIRTTNEFGGGEPVISLLANSGTVAAEVIIDPGIRALGGSEIQLKRRVEVWERMDINIQGLYSGDALVVGSGTHLQGYLRVGTSTYTSTASGTIRAGNNAHFGNTSAHDSAPTTSNWSTADNASTTVLLHGLNYTTIGFHDSGNRVDFIRSGPGGNGGAAAIDIGHNGGWGSARTRAMGGLYVDGDAGSGETGMVGFTDVTSDWNNITLGNGQVKMLGDTNRNSKGWLKIYIGTAVRYIPYWETITG